MRVGSKLGLVLVAAGCSAIGCARKGGSPADNTVEIQGALAARAAACTLTLPFGTDAGRFVVGANGSLQLADRVKVTAPIENMGTAGTQIGVDAQVGDVYSFSQITLRDRATVNGSVFTRTALAASPFARLLGPVNTNAVLTPAAMQTIPANFPASGDIDILLEPDQTASPAPGRYRNAQVKSRAKLNLRSGTYFFETFGVIEPQAQVILDERQGPVIIFVNQPITFRGVVTSNIGLPDWMIGVITGGTVTIESSFQGTIVAPLASINLGTGELTHTGAFFGRDVLVQPGVKLVQHTSSALSRCAAVIGGVQDHDLTPHELGPVFDPMTGAPFPGTFVHGVDVTCTNPQANRTQDPVDQNGLATFQLVANPSCSTQVLFCDAVTGAVLNPQPTLAQLNAPPPAGSTCQARTAVDRCLCPVDPLTLGATCNFSSDCPTGQVCATICSGPGCAVPRRCGKFVAGCDGAPAQANCQDLVICPDPNSVGTITIDELRASLPPPNAPTPGTTPPAQQQPVDHFLGASALIQAGKDGTACRQGPVAAALPVVDQGAQNGTSKGKSNWGIAFTPSLSQSSVSQSLEPFGLVLPNYSAKAGLDVTATVFGASIQVFSAQAIASVNLCDAKATVTVSVGPTADQNPGQTRQTPAGTKTACDTASDFLKRATTLLNWGEAQALAVIDQYTTLGPDPALCARMSAQFPDLAPQLNCAGAPVLSAQRIVDRINQQYFTAVNGAIGAANSYASALGAIDDAVSSGDEVVFFDKPLEVLGAEANFPVGPFIVTVGGSVNARFTVTGAPHLDLSTTPGGDSTIGAGFTVTPSAIVNATAFIGIGFAVVTVGVSGTVQLIGIHVPATIQVNVLSHTLTDPRLPANDGYSFDLLSKNNPSLAVLAPHRYGWDSSWGLNGTLNVDSFLSGQLDAFLRIKFLFFSKTFSRKIVSWSGISPESVGLNRSITLFNLQSPLPFSGTTPPILTASNIAYVSPPAGAAVAIAPLAANQPLSPVQVTNLGVFAGNSDPLCGAIIK